MSLSPAYSHTKYDCLGIHVQSTDASVVERCHTFAVVAEVTCTWALGRVSDLENVEIFSCFGASGSVMQPPSSSPQEVHVIKQRGAFRGLQSSVPGSIWLLPVFQEAKVGNLDSQSTPRVSIGGPFWGWKRFVSWSNAITLVAPHNSRFYVVACLGVHSVHMNSCRLGQWRPAVHLAPISGWAHPAFSRAAGW